ncbi:MAG: FecR domain-containing protein [Bacteroidota bacterium]
MKIDEIERLLDLYLKGRLSATQKTRLEDHLDEFQHPEKADHEFNEQHADELWKKISAKTTLTQPRRTSWIPIAAALAVVALAIAIAWSWNNNTGLANKLILSDGTIVWLKDQATLDHSLLSPSDRQVSLKGEALFEVAKDQRHPFVIHCGQYVAKVLGTSFNIKATDSAVELTVLTGKVRISSLSADSSVVVNPNEHIVLRGKTINKTESQPAEVVSITKDTQYNMHFEDTSMEEIARRVEGKFDVHIKLEDDDLRNCMISADFTDQSLSITLTMIAEALSARYTIDGKQILISGAGCEK